MKFLKIIILVLPLRLFAGGVDVGNGTAVVVDFYSRSFSSEEHLMNHLEKAVENIKSNKYSELSTNIKDAECENLEIHKIEPVEAYEVKNSKIIFNILYKAIIKLELYNCKKPYLLKLEYKPKYY